MIRVLSLILLAFSSFDCFAQNTQKTESFEPVDSVKEHLFMRADSIVLSNTSILFLKHLVRDTGIFAFTYLANDSTFNPDTVYNDSILKTRYHVGYTFKKPEKYPLYLRNEHGGYAIARLDIAFDESYKVARIPEFEVYTNAFEQVQRTSILEPDRASTLARELFSRGTRPLGLSPLLMFETQSGLLYWQITRQKGFRKVMQEHVLIDAETGAFIRKDTTVLVKTFWQAIRDLF